MKIATGGFNKAYVKLVIAIISLLVAVVMIVTVSYAWLTLSESPAVNGIQVTIGGGNTILIAPDLTKTVGDTVVHYPGSFDGTLVLSQYDTYDYLNNLAGLTPVSTADGVQWFFPAYDADNMQLSDYADFTADNTLARANSTTTAGYAYLDFWLVSPGSQYDVRVATDTDSKDGSFVIELPQVETDADNSAVGYRLSETADISAASVRVGFLVNNDKVTDNQAMAAYSASLAYAEQYSKLLGVYREPTDASFDADSAFSIFEPNATQHPGIADAAGKYYITQPLTRQNETVQTTNISDILAVQTANIWRTATNGQSLLFQEMLTALIGKVGLTDADADAEFYVNHLQNQVIPYVQTGLFITDTAQLYDTALNGVVPENSVNAMATAGAACGAVITRLERNVPQRVRMFVWLEGQDVDCTNTTRVEASRLAVRIELAGADT